ncbi:alpha/beta fold hydrolase [Saccharopolyspora phatthalungensis]|uniref:Pimeloyl-ACP methyl ester carboxylesterase n=1 Tax=Saccharopolyspora phatthalungensis TaxID=664693 RepID=A0A840QKD1_9PSEU|nr:alpha/beta hydrolase [Saccharopolyspora phatthalungensis]MBB5159795.1 pimeloyl-ACP methyl ester carboxylesterase [Saccharopolyspora phatthalungensis]
MGLQTATAVLNDVQVHYCTNGCGPAVVFVHGLAEDHGSWRHQQQEFADHRTYAYDLRGHGNSTLGEAEGSLGQLRDDLVAFLSEVSGPAVCVGFSLGGTVVLSAAAQRPDLVTGVVVLGTSSVVGRTAAEFYLRRAEQATDPGEVLESLREDTSAMVTDSTVDIAELVAKRGEAIGDGRGYANAATAMAGLRGNPLTPELAAINCPVTVIGGENDAFCPRKAADILLDALPHATYREIPNAGHLMNVDNRHAVTTALRHALTDR